MGEHFLLVLAEGEEARAMTQDMTRLPADLEQLRQQFAEFRATQPVRSRLPEPLWAAATELATRYGVPATARVLHLDYTRLKTRVASRKRPKPARPVAPPTTFVELLGPAGAVTRCTVEVEAAPGKLRLELPAIATAELVPLLRAFLGH
jgi:hypothetical protein